jgi:hypothetical protein
MRLYPLYCTLYYCTLTLTFTHCQPSALVALSFTFVSDSVFKFYSVHFIGYNFHSTFRLQFHLEIISFFPNSVFLLEVSRELPQCSILNTLPIASIFSLLLCAVSSPWLPDTQLTNLVSGYFNPVCYSVFVCVTFQPMF